MARKNRYRWIITIFFTFFNSCTSNDTITQNQSFKDGDLLVSSGNTFAFGFFSPGNSLNRYVGIWYNKVSEPTVVWVANRDNPFNGTGGVLSIENSGYLVLRDGFSNILLWSTNISSKSTANSSYSVQLLDTGNLVLFEDDGNTSIISWQSFDYPTNTFLAHMKQGVNLKSGQVWSLTSWKSKDDPGTGDFQYFVELNGSPQFFSYDSSKILWRSGPWNGIGLSGIPDMMIKSFLSVEYIQNDDEVSLSYLIDDPSMIIRISMDESGTLSILTWQEDHLNWANFWSALRDQCDYYGNCGSFSICDPYNIGEFVCRCLPGYEPKNKSEWDLRDGINGCTRTPGKQTCGNSSADVGFIKLSPVKVPDTRNAVLNKILGLKECEELCLSNCSCTGYASSNISGGGSGCITWYGDLMDMRQFSDLGQDVYVRVSASELAQYLKRSKKLDSKKLIIFLVPSTAGVLLLCLAIWFVLWKLKGQRQNVRKILGLTPDQVSSYGVTPLKEMIDEKGEIPNFNLRTIISATNSFAISNKLGEGGFGSVFKGQLQNGKEIAVKRLSKTSGQGTEEFKSESTLITRLQHRNLVKLVGCCIEQEENMLVYEYLPNKGLDNFIFGKEKRVLLDWRKRFEIILGIARGMVYLHHDSRLKIIHRDLKASNVLLDANMEPKISDFGMARIFGADQFEARTHRVVGTFGYMSPEYAMQGLFSEKSDVFSYGILLLEIITGKRSSNYFSDNTLNLTGYVWGLWKEGKALDLVDPAIGKLESHHHDEVARCIQIGLLCVQDHANDRPTMSKVLSMLCNETSIAWGASPKKPAFVFEKANHHSDIHPYCPRTSSGGASMNDVTISVLQAR